MPDGALGVEPVSRSVNRPRRLLAPRAAVHGLRGARATYDETTGARTLAVWLYRAPPAQLVDPSPLPDGYARPWSLVAPPGAPPVSIGSAARSNTPDPHLVLALAGEPSTARYLLRLDAPTGVEVDPLRSTLPVRLRPECEAASCFDADATPLPPPPAPSPVHDYGARDWSSLRRALVEFLLREDPGADLSPADPTITLLELFAHVGDLLHYRLDRVATEAYLETARLRTSVRRHARLVDYRLSDGVSARTFVAIAVEPTADGKDRELDVEVDDVATDASGSALAFTVERVPSAPAGATGPALEAHAALSEIAVYDWGEPGGCLTAGATGCALVRPRPADPLGGDWLRPGDLLAFELVDPDDATQHAAWASRAAHQPWPPAPGPSRFRPALPGRPSQVVELTSVEPFDDPLAPRTLELARVAWRREDALTRAFPVSIVAPEGVSEVVVARGNVLPAHHGRVADGDGTLELRSASEYALGACGTPAGPRRAGGPGLSLRADGTPYRLDVDVDLPSQLTVRATVLDSLLDAPPGELACVVDVEEHEPPLLRFVTGSVGVAPPLDSVVRAVYEVGCGRAGNVPAGALRLLERRNPDPLADERWLPLAAARNPVAATGGAEPTPLDVARRDAPQAYAAEPRRAVVPADVAAAAAADPSLVRFAIADRGWTGSWPLTTARLDLVEPGDAGAVASVQAQLDALRLLGTEVVALEARVVGIVLALEICVVRGADAALARRQVLAALRPGSDSRPGLFHPSRLPFGAEVYVSAAVAAVGALPLVDAVEVLEARRLDEPRGTVHAVISFRPDEVPALDDDPDRPERGRLDVVIGGGA